MSIQNKIREIISSNKSENIKIAELNRFIESLKPKKSAQISTSSMVDKIIICKGEKSTGTGFLTHFKKANIIVTCMHVFMGNKNMKFLTPKMKS